MTWQVHCIDCDYKAQKLPREQAEFYAKMHKTNNGHQVMIYKEAKGRGAIGKMA